MKGSGARANGAGGEKCSMRTETSMRESGCVIRNTGKENSCMVRMFLNVSLQFGLFVVKKKKLNLTCGLANGSWYEGSWKDGKRNGSGKCYNSEKGLLYVGFWIDGEAKCGTLCEYEKDKAPEPLKCKFPKVKHRKKDA